MNSDVSEASGNCKLFDLKNWSYLLCVETKRLLSLLDVFACSQLPQNLTQYLMPQVSLLRMTGY